MKWMDFLERRFGRLGIPRLVLYLVAGKAVVWLFSVVNPSFPGALSLDPQAIMAGQVWRLVTFVFLVSYTHPIQVMFYLYLFFLGSSALESVWGPFRFTLYYFVGAAATAVLAFTPLNVTSTPFYLELSLVFAFATLFPDAAIYILALIPVKAKWAAWATLAYLGYTLYQSDIGGRAAIIISLANYLMFFWHLIIHRVEKLVRVPGDLVPPIARPRAVHKCAVCGRTELDDREMGFRICACAECGEGREFCEVHLKDHLKRIGRA